MKTKLLIAYSLILLTVVAQAQQKGSIQGRVTDEKTGQPLVGVNVIIMKSVQGAVTDMDGRYRISALDAGSYLLRFSMIGYNEIKKLNVEVHPGNQTNLNVELSQSVIELQKIVVTAPAFQKAKAAVVSERSIDLGEIRSDPGSIDIQRAVTVLPSVSGSSDQINELIVRSGFPGENLFLMDDIEIPNPNHFAQQGTGGGPINLINNEFIQNVDFYAGAFPANYGDAASSVMNIQFREGSHDKNQYYLNMGMAGAGGYLEGPLGTKGSFLVAAEKSYLDLVKDSFGLSAVPHYWHAQGKLTYQLTAKHKLSLNAIYGSDEIEIVNTEEKSWTRGADYVRNIGYTYALGTTLRSVWDNQSYSKLTLYQNRCYINYDVDQYIRESVRRDYYNKADYETESAVKFFYSRAFSSAFDIQCGGQYKAINLDYRDSFYGDTLYWYTGEIPDSIYKIWDSNFLTRTSDDAKISGFISSTFHPMRTIKVILGLRSDYFSYNDETTFSPRLGLGWALRPNLSLNLAYGRHHQTPFYFLLMLNDDDEPVLSSKYSDHIVAGIEYYPEESIKISAELFTKEYFRVPVANHWLTADTTDDFEYYVNKGRARAQGLEFYFHKKLFDRWFAIVSYSYSKAKSLDPRYNQWGPGDYDYRQIFNAVGSYRFSKTDGWSRFMKILALNSDEFSLSARYRYAGGRPYTQQNYDPRLRRWYIPRESPLNNRRFPAYQRFDINFQWRVRFQSAYLVSYMNVQNIFNRRNIWDYQYNPDGTISEILQYTTFIVGGFILEF